MAQHTNLQSLSVEGIEEYLTIAEYCVNARKANGGIYGFPALLLLLCVVDAITVNSGGKRHTLERIRGVVPLTDGQLKFLRDWYRHPLAHQAVIAPGVMLSDTNGAPIELNSSGEPTHIRVIPLYEAVKKLWNSFSTQMNPQVHPMNAPKAPVLMPALGAPGITGCDTPAATIVVSGNASNKK